MELRGKRLLLRPWRRGDEDALVRHADNPNVSRFLRDRFPSPYTRADAEAWIAHVVGSQGPPTDFAIVVGDEPVGGAGLDRFTDVHAVGAEVGYWLAEPCWGRGLATEAVVTLLPYAFGALGLLRVQAMVYGPNTASARVLEKAGFSYEGRMRGAVRKHGVVHDVLLYARLREDPGP
jgi:RimJ/RimL family protein N-acetyltransferase